MKLGNIDMDIDENSGEITIKHCGSSVFSTITPVLFYNDDWISEQTGELIFDGITTTRGINYENNPDLVEFIDIAKSFRVTQDNEQFTCILHFVVFPKNQAIYFMVELQGNAFGSEKIGGYIDLGVPLDVNMYRFFHASGIETTGINAAPRVGMALFEPHQDSWQRSVATDALPDNEDFPMSYMLAKRDSNIVAFVPVDRFGQITTIRCCSFMAIRKSKQRTEPIPNGVKFVSGTFMPACKYDHLAGGLVAFGEDPIELSASIYKTYMHLICRRHALRETKTYPEPFEYIGFCTWNTFYAGVDMRGVKDLLEENFTAESGSDRFKYLIVDDGWQSINGMSMAGDDDSGPKKTDHGLRRFDANKKFPNDIGEVVRLAKHKYNVKWVGVWHATFGYWPGVEPNSPLGECYPIVLHDKIGVPDPTDFKGFQFWHDYYAHLRSQGIDLLKIDNQSAVGRDLQGIGLLDDVIEKHYDMQQGAAFSQNLAILNCMCMPSYCYTRWKSSSVSRVSGDFGPGNFKGLKKQIKQCTFNPLSYGQFCWPDHDMVQTKPGTNGCPVHPLWLVHAVSGGPVYIADEVGETDGNVVEKLSFQDGRIPRLESVSMPTVDAVFGDEDRDAACKAWNYDDIPGWGRVFYYFLGNMTNDDVQISSTISIGDMGSMAYAGNTIPAEHVIKDVESSFTRLVASPDEQVTTDLEPMQAKYFIISPLLHNIALLGIEEVYNGTKAIERSHWESDEVLYVDCKYGGMMQIFAKNPDWITVKDMSGISIPVERDTVNPQIIRFKIENACMIYLA